MTDCTVCAHPQRYLIETDLCVSERPDWRALRQKYGLHHLALIGHKREHMKPAALAKINISRVFDSSGIVPDEADGCLCYWCRMSGYQRLLRAWAEANTQEKERFCADTRTMDVPF